MIQQTSRFAYVLDVLPTLGNRHKAVMDAFTKRESFTNSELAEFLGWPINTITPRVKELRNRKLLQEKTRRRCNITGRTAIVWEVKPDDEQISLF